jgi:DNA-binding PadR family transcriptional regulator
MIGSCRYCNLQYQNHTADCSMVKSVKDLTTTSYAVLGLLALKPWTGYELSQQMQRSMAFIWPRAERAIYDEPTNLVAHGLAKAASEPAGNRPRTVYRITAKGRRALAAWLTQPSAPPAFESEAMVRATYAEYGDKEALLRTIAGLREHAEQLHAGAGAVVASYLEERAPFPDRAHIVALNGRFILDYIAMVRRWTDWASDVVSDWSDTRSPDVWPEALEEFRRAFEASLSSDAAGPH